MAARDAHFSGSKVLPNITPKQQEIKKTRKEMKYRAFAKPLTLPSIDLMYADLDKISTLFSKKQLCKKVSEWFSNWRPWQQRILLCSMTEKCSKSQLRTLVTSLEPVFHRDFVAQLKGYPTKLLQPKFVHTISTMVDNEEFLRYRGLLRSETQTTVPREKTPDTSSLTESTQNSKLERLEKVSELDEEYSEACYHEVAIDERVEFDHYSQESDLPLASFAVTPATEVGLAPLRKHEHAPPFVRRVSTRHFFPEDTSSIGEKLGTMKSVRKVGDREKVFGADPHTFKKSKWWEGHQGSKLLKARRSKLSKYFKLQLNQIHQWLDEWSQHERVDMLAEVVKCCDADCLNFFALCLGRRLRDQTSIDSLPDHILHKVFNLLDIRSLCRSSQVCHRWKYLCQDPGIWTNRLKMLGKQNGVLNLPRKIQDVAKNLHVDWKRAYVEMRTFYKDSGEIEEQPGEPDEDQHQKKLPPLTFFSAVKTMGGASQKQPQPDKSDSPSGHELVDVVVVKQMNNVGPAQTPTTADRKARKNDFESKVEDQNDLTGGNLKMLAKSLRMLLKEKDEKPEEEEVALDIRPALIQASNVLEKGKDHTKFRYLSLAVQGVLAIKKVTRLQGHMDGVYCLQFDTRRVMTGSLDRTLRIWDVRSGKSIHKIKGHKGGIRCLQFDDEKIITGSWDMTIMVWHIVYFNRLHVLYGHKGCVSCLRFNEFLLVSGSHDKTIRIWKTSTWECIMVIEAHDGPVTCLEFDGKRVLSGSVDRTLKLWDVETGELVRVFNGHEEAVSSLKIMSKLVISGSVDGMIMFWDLETGCCEAAIQAHEGPVHSLSACMEHFISSGGDNLIKEWDMTTCTCLRTLQGHRGPVQCVTGSKNRIISCSSDGTVRIWDLEDRPLSKRTNILLDENTIEARVIRSDLNINQHI